jgi:DNA-binding PadR family transcriptional regulator
MKDSIRHSSASTRAEDGRFRGWFGNGGDDGRRETSWFGRIRGGHGEHGGHGGRGGHGPFSRQGRGYGSSDDDFSRGRKFSSEELQILLLDLLAQEPRHGYELIKLLDTRSNGFYAPSPGMVYPALTYLEEIGYALVAAEGNRKRYALTDSGRAYVDTNRERIDLLWAKLNFFAQKMGLVRRALAEDGADEERSGKHPLRALLDARMRLKEQLILRRHASPEEQLRIAGVLERAAAEIAAGTDKQPEEDPS